MTNTATTTVEPAAIAEDLARALEVAPSLEARLAAIDTAIPGRVVFSTSLGIEDQAVLHALHHAAPRFDVFTLDTGRHFPETLDTLEESQFRYGSRIRVVFPEAADVEALVARDGINGFKYDVDNRKACCDVRKVRPLNKALKGAAGWITGLRRDQSAGRAAVPFAVYDPVQNLIKLNPIADWSLEQLETYVTANKIPINALHAKGFPSIGCQPCTRAIKPGEDIRAGRWWWENEDGKECGLHNNPNRPNSNKTKGAST
jgi:phosphoadenosine phosphosulfate reductase